MFLDTCELLESSGHEVVRFCAKHEDSLPTRWSHWFPEAADFDSPGGGDLLRYLSNPAAARALSNLLDKHPVDVAHLHIYYGKLTTSILRPLVKRGIPIVHTCHEYRMLSPNYALTHNGRVDLMAVGPGNAWRAVTQRFNRGSISRSLLATLEWYQGRRAGSLKHMDRLIAISDFQGRLLAEHGVPAAKVRHIDNFTPMPTAPPTQGRGEHVLYFGRLDPVKGLGTLLDAAERLPKLRFLIAGEGEGRSMITDRGLPNVRTLGFQSGDTLDKLIRQSICTVLPAEWYEPFGLTVIETMLRGRPAVASRIGALPELIEHGKTGLLHEPGDAEGLAKCLAILSREPKSADALGWRGYERARKRFSPERHLRKLSGLYKEVVAERTKS